jgi:hypothetical protein
MMMEWTFAASLVDEVARLLRAMEKHRYLLEVDHRLHFSVDIALSDKPHFLAHATKFTALCEKNPDLNRASRDPRLWRKATSEEVIDVLTAFWGPSDEAEPRRERLFDLFKEIGLPIGDHEPFESDPERPPFPELVMLDWTLLPVDQLDTEKHAGALAALETETDDYQPSEPIYQEGPAITIVELCDGAPFGILAEDISFWSEGPYAYADYVFRGVSKAAKLEEPPVGMRDDQGEEEPGEPGGPGAAPEYE